MNEYEHDISDEELTFLSSLVRQLVREWNLREKDGRMTDTVRELLGAYCRLCGGALACIIELFEFSVNDSIGKWLHNHASYPDQLAKSIFLNRLAAELPGTLKDLFEELSLSTVDILNSRISRELSDSGYRVLPYNYLAMRDFQTNWSGAFAQLVSESVFERIDAMELDRLFPPCQSEERRKEIMGTAGIALVPRMVYEVNRIREIVSARYRTPQAFSEFSDEVSLSVWVWLERVREHAEH